MQKPLNFQAILAISNFALTILVMVILVTVLVKNSSLCLFEECTLPITNIPIAKEAHAEEIPVINEEDASNVQEKQVVKKVSGKSNTLTRDEITAEYRKIVSISKENIGYPDEVSSQEKELSSRISKLKTEIFNYEFQLKFSKGNSNGTWTDQQRTLYESLGAAKIQLADLQAQESVLILKLQQYNLSVNSLVKQSENSLCESSKITESNKSYCHSLFK